MENIRVVITYTIASERRKQVRSLFDKNVTVCFLSDMTDEERDRELAEASVLLSWNPARELKPREFGLLARLRMIQLLPAGADHVPFRELPREIIIACNIGAYSEPVAEHVLGMALALAKNLFPEHLKLSQGEFDQSRQNRMMKGSVCGILGFGGIGRATARLMRCLGARIYAVNTSGRTEEPVDFIGTLRDLRHVLSSADFLVLSLPLNRYTRRLIGKRELDTMKPNAILINVARGEIIDEEALYEHLLTHPGFSSGIDAWWIEPYGQVYFHTKHPFFVLPNVLGSPHNSGTVPGMEERVTKLAVENVKRFLQGEPVTGLVRREDYL